MGQVLPYVLSCRWGDDGDRGSVQNGNPFRHRGLEKTGTLRIWNQMPKKFVIPNHLGRLQASELRPTETHVCRVVVAGIAEELTPLFLKQAGWLPDVLPNVIANRLLPQHLWVRLSPHVLFIFRNRNRSPVSRFINFRPPYGAGWILQPKALCWRLIRMFRSTFPYLVPQLSFLRSPQKIAIAHSVPDGSLGGQARALAHVALATRLSCQYILWRGPILVS